MLEGTRARGHTGGRKPAQIKTCRPSVAGPTSGSRSARNVALYRLYMDQDLSAIGGWANLWKSPSSKCGSISALHGALPTAFLLRGY